MPPPPLRLPSAGAGTPVLVILGVGFPCFSNSLLSEVHTHTNTHISRTHARTHAHAHAHAHPHTHAHTHTHPHPHTHTHTHTRAHTHTHAHTPAHTHSRTFTRSRAMLGHAREWAGLAGLFAGGFGRGGSLPSAASVVSCTEAPIAYTVYRLIQTA